MNNTTEIKIDEHNIFEVRNKDLIRWALPVIQEISLDFWKFKIDKTKDFVGNFLDYLEEEIK